MISCALCGFDNIEGVDLCDQCGQPLHDSHLPSPQNAVERGLLGDRLDSLSPKTPIAVSATSPVGDVLTLMQEKHIGCVFVLEDGKPVGVFSERDALLRLNTKAAELSDQPVANFMTPNPQQLEGTNRIAYAVHQMDLGGYRHIPIVDPQGKAVGVISVRDILNYLTEKMMDTTSG